MPHLTIVVAVDEKNGIGIDNKLPWRLPEDLAHFKRITMGHPVIMGRKTYDSIGRPLPNRRNIVITRNPAWKQEGVETASSLQAAIGMVGDVAACIIGGSQIFAEALPLTDRLIVTEIAHGFACDTFFPAIDRAQWKEIAREVHHSASNGFDYAFVTYEKA
ncbi:MAG TPA: dihydrofolate reductase [Noviherbaspirillum sp.]|uniref:dihydrofolate reductase n=1 Tax=Noviherbaspirillum sp. TaxID=1926288 RepID=UPI002D437BA7|nr:dihydrofolate reductase [Noviherbaspirillum sp.]HYD97244.1 dihydrofolate reductase [Noviherbaspirillum sp.]